MTIVVAARRCGDGVGGSIGGSGVSGSDGGVGDGKGGVAAAVARVAMAWLRWRRRQRCGSGRNYAGTKARVFQLFRGDRHPFFFMVPYRIHCANYPIVPDVGFTVV